MLTIIDVPEEIVDLYKRSKLPASAIVSSIAKEFPSQSIEAGTDLCAACPSSMVVIRNGMFKYLTNGKLIRFYSTGDIISVPEKPLGGIAITNEFGAEICVIPSTRFVSLVASDRALLDHWSAYQHASDVIMHVLCSLHIKEDFEPHAELRQYKAGETVIKEGDKPDYLFEMLEGTASVTVRGTEIGTVHEGEVFGEVSFLTGTERGATVIATSSCLIQAIKRPDLELFAKHRPGLIYKLSQTLAYRLNEVNKRLVSISSLT
ncbi:MAG: cyclic nucleotide-binding domain-containing protein [Chitinivibrionales bacterium]|nr:cyclic nucleotide-binding domain-containing protein [Chitinivibrionales bacterium]MBD3396465.1 cyclic nucleotide-binding domain-containing protein [Chitinivibrionales bacterium]